MGQLDGTWYNELGSVMTVQTNGNTISGTYQSGVSATGIFELVGRTDADGDPNQTVGWVVAWQNQYENYYSVTSWSGELQTIDGLEIIVTTWLLTQETDPGDDWKSTMVGKDYFTRIIPTEETIAANRKRGVVGSFPTKK